MQRQQALGLALLPASTVGVLCNWTIVTVVVSYRSLHRPFAILTATLAACHATASTASLFFVIPMMVLDLHNLKENWNMCGFVVLLAYEISAQTHVAISLNRFIAVYCPFNYNTIFRPRNTRILIPLIVIISTATIATFMLFFECRLEYDNVKWTFLVTETPKCTALAWSVLFAKNLLFSIADIILHVITIFRVFKMKRSAARGQNSRGYSLQETYFLKQTFGHTIFMFIELIAYTFPPRTQSDYISFLFSTFLWCAIHATEGIITLVYNTEIRRMLQKACHRTSKNAAELPGS